jgi:hypothetical protein
LDNFIANGRAFSSDELAKCNAAAPLVEAPALAKR